MCASADKRSRTPRGPLQRTRDAILEPVLRETVMLSAQKAADEIERASRAWQGFVSHGDACQAAPRPGVVPAWGAGRPGAGWPGLRSLRYPYRSLPRKQKCPVVSPS